MRVKVLGDAGATPCACGELLKHWALHSGEPMLRLCPVLRCTAAIYQAARVHRVRTLGEDSVDQVLPLCAAHARDVGAELEVRDTIRLVSARCDAERG